MSEFLAFQALLQNRTKRTHVTEMPGMQAYGAHLIRSCRL